VSYSLFDHQMPRAEGFHPTPGLLHNKGIKNIFLV
jgi:hypothetical protein